MRPTKHPSRSPPTAGPRFREHVLWLTAVAALAMGCTRPVPAAEVAREIRARLEIRNVRAADVRSEGLLKSEAVGRFYKAREYRPAWRDRDDPEQIVESIRGVARDGLTPSHYHLDAITRLLEERGERGEAALEAELELLMTDAVAAILDHTRYGKVRPSSIDSRWNVNPRKGAPPLEQVVEEIARSGRPAEGIEKAKPQHFIYRGLVGALERLREIERKGGWPRVPAGKALRPGMSDARIAAVRARLALTGELPADAASGSTRYDPQLRRAVQLFQSRHRLEEDGIIDRAMLAAMNVTAGERAAQVRVNLERARWVLGDLEDDFLLVNLPAFKAYLIRDGRNIWEARTQVGEEGKQSPPFRALMRTVVFHPDWSVPRSILVEEMVPQMNRGVDVLARQNLVVVNASGEEVDPSTIDWASAADEGFPYGLKQRPGPGNALGRVKFLFPNPYSIYLHDTPNKHLFEAERRTFSHGCIRLERPLELARILLAPQGWGTSRIREALDSGETRNVNLSRPIPVMIVYWTVSVGATGEIKYTRDIYELDPPVLAALKAPPRVGLRRPVNGRARGRAAGFVPRRCP